MPKYDKTIFSAVENTLARFGIMAFGFGFDSDKRSCEAVYVYPAEPEVMHPLDDIVVLL